MVLAVPSIMAGSVALLLSSLPIGNGSAACFIEELSDIVSVSESTVIPPMLLEQTGRLSSAARILVSDLNQAIMNKDTRES